MDGKKKTNKEDKTKKQHPHGLTYIVKFPMKNLLESYNGQTGRRLIERVNEHSRKDITSQMFKHSMAANHPTVTLDGFTILAVVTATGSLRRWYQNVY